jgi:NADPH:quinone reductase-like Zn-dependent oxidoreductase
MANTCGLIYHREAAACVTAIGPSVETTGADTRVVYQGDLIVTGYYASRAEARRDAVKILKEIKEQALQAF